MGTINYKIIRERNLLIQRFSGEITKTDMANFFVGLYKDNEYLRVSFIFSDFSNAIVALSEEDMIEIAHFIRTHAPTVNYVINSILVSEPLVTAYSLLYHEVMKEMPQYTCCVFSTFLGASKYIGFAADELKVIIEKSYW